MKDGWLTALLSWWPFAAFAVAWVFWRRRPTTIEWSQRHPTLRGITIGFVMIGAALSLLFDPISALFIVVAAVTYGLAAFFDPKTYSRTKPLDQNKVGPEA
ncbi:MAG: hypothetical protein JWQ17_3030 [Tardiphaga sp.]|jgi:hypothetical protein|nr:hypothetical protein [Tardiphaga sp.]